MFKKKTSYVVSKEDYLDLRKKELKDLQRRRLKEKKKPSFFSRIANAKKPSEDIREDLNKDFLNYIVPSDIRFKNNYFILGDEFRSIWAVRHFQEEYKDLALLRYLAALDNVHLKIKCKELTIAEENRILEAADRRTTQAYSSTGAKDKLEATYDAESLSLTIQKMYRNKEKLIDCLVLIELRATSLESLLKLQDEVNREINALKINVDKLTTRQLDAFKACMFAPNDSTSHKVMDKFYKALPQSSIANLYPFSYSGKTDVNGFSLGRDKSGGNIIVDFTKRDSDKTTSNILILGDSGQGKSYLLKGIIVNILMSGSNLIAIDPEHELEDMCNKLGGTYMNIMSGDIHINPLEPRSWRLAGDTSDTSEANDFVGSSFGKFVFESKGVVTQHISWLKDWFIEACDMTKEEVLIVELFLRELYDEIGLDDDADMTFYKSEDFPVLSELYDLIDNTWRKTSDYSKVLYTSDHLKSILLKLNSMAKGADSKYYNHHTNISSDRFTVFGVDELLETNRQFRNGMFFLLLSYMSNELLRRGNTYLSIDELYLLLNNMTIIEYIRNFMKRIRKRDGGVMLSSQNIEEFMIGGIKEYTKPLLSIPTYHFYFYPGEIKENDFKDMLKVTDSEFSLIRQPNRGQCLFKCGSERYLLKVEFARYKSDLFGDKGGR